MPVPSPIAAHSKCLKMPRVVAPLSPACCPPRPPTPPSAAFPCLSNAVSKTCTADCQPSSLYLHPPPQALPHQYRSSAAVCSTQQQSLPQVPSCSPNTSTTAQRCPPNKLLRSVPTRDFVCYSHQHQVSCCAGAGRQEAAWDWAFRPSSPRRRRRWSLHRLLLSK